MFAIDKRSGKSQEYDNRAKFRAFALSDISGRKVEHRFAPHAQPRELIQSFSNSGAIVSSPPDYFRML